MHNRARHASHQLHLLVHVACRLQAVNGTLPLGHVRLPQISHPVAINFQERYNDRDLPILQFCACDTHETPKKQGGGGRGRLHKEGDDGESSRRKSNVATGCSVSPFGARMHRPVQRQIAAVPTLRGRSSNSAREYHHNVRVVPRITPLSAALRARPLPWRSRPGCDACCQ